MILFLPIEYRQFAFSSYSKRFIHHKTACYEIVFFLRFCLIGFYSLYKTRKGSYIFTSHREPALDGLHYLYSYDGYHWDSIAGSWLKPEIGNKTPYYNYFTKQTEEQKYAPNSMMRDPSITQGPDGVFHLVWTIS